MFPALGLSQVSLSLHSLLLYLSLLLFLQHSAHRSLWCIVLDAALSGTTATHSYRQHHGRARLGSFVRTAQRRVQL